MPRRISGFSSSFLAEATAIATELGRLPSSPLTSRIAGFLSASKMFSLRAIASIGCPDHDFPIVTIDARVRLLSTSVCACARASRGVINGAAGGSAASPRVSSVRVVKIIGHISVESSALSIVYKPTSHFSTTYGSMWNMPSSVPTRTICRLELSAGVSSLTSIAS